MNVSRESVEEQAILRYRQHFGSSPTVVASAPGRVNLIGEHTDYNDGFVLPAAIDRAIAVAAALRDDGRLVLNSGSATADESFPLTRLYPSEQRSWTDYPVGVASLLQDRGIRLRGATMHIAGRVPRGAGLSSSAALELATAFALMELSTVTIPREEVARLCQRAEHEFAGVQCGIMDQFISCLGKSNHALLLDCRSLSYEYVPIPDGVQLLVCDTGIRRALALSEYNRRREECSNGVQALSAKLPGIRALRDVTADQLNEYGTMLDPIIRRRCRHVITENDRVRRSAPALMQGNLSEFGKLMYDSHLSLRRDYEVSCDELDTIVDICAEAEGVYGARMTGAGFGGCAICLVKQGSTQELIERLNREYPQRSKKTISIYLFTIDEGAASRTLEH